MEAISAGELATRTSLTTGGVTRVIDRLHRAGFVRREPDQGDRRRVLIMPLPDQLAEIATIYQSVSAGWAELLADYGDEQLHLLLDLFTRMRELSDEQIQALRRGDRAANSPG